MDAGVAVAVGDVELAGGRRHQLGGVVEGAGGAGNEVAGDLAAGVGVAPVAAQHLHRLAVEGVDQAGGGVAVGDVDHVVLNVEAVGEEKGAVAPGVLQVAVAVEDENGRLLALEGVDAVLGVGGDGADHGEGLALGQLGPVLLEGVGVVAGAEGGHVWPPVGLVCVG